MGFLKEFKEFAVKGNVMDMAVGVIIGGAFGKIVTSVVNDIIMPPIGLLVGGVDFTDMKLTMKKAVLDAHPNLRSMYNENDDNIAVYYFTDATATISSFSGDQKTLNF